MKTVNLRVDMDISIRVPNDTTIEEMNEALRQFGSFEVYKPQGQEPGYDYLDTWDIVLSYPNQLSFICETNDNELEE